MAAGMVTAESWFCWTPSARFGGDGQGHCCAGGDGQLREEHWGRTHIPTQPLPGAALHHPVPLEITGFQPEICRAEIYLWQE